MTRLSGADLTLAYDQRVVAAGLDVRIPDGSLTVIVDPNACGKSTTRYATHLIAMKAGAVVAEGDPADIITAELVESVYGMRCEVIPDPQTGTPLVVPAARAVRRGSARTPG